MTKYDWNNPRLERQWEMIKSGPVLVKALGPNDDVIGLALKCWEVEGLSVDAPGLLLHIGNASEIHMMTLWDLNDDMLCFAGISPDEAAEQYGFPAELLSDTWAGGLLGILEEKK